MVIDFGRLKRILVDYCEWNITVEGWVISDEKLDDYLDRLDELEKEQGK